MIHIKILVYLFRMDIVRQIVISLFYTLIIEVFF